VSFTLQTAYAGLSTASAITITYPTGFFCLLRYTSNRHMHNNVRRFHFHHSCIIHCNHDRSQFGQRMGQQRQSVHL